MERGHILELLKEAKQAFKDKDVIKLKDLSNETIHSASVEQDEISIALAVVIYSLSKIMERTNYQEYPSWSKFLRKSEMYLEDAIEYLDRNKEKQFKKSILNIEKLINQLTGNFKTHVQQVFERARINKASRIYEHGISMEKTARLLGITIFDLAEYAGKTGISDINLSKTLPVDERIQYAMEMFK
jgi:hypothetical protein